MFYPDKNIHNLKKLEINFGAPENGWLAVSLESGDYKLEMDVSDVPVNPLEQLCTTITLLATNTGNPTEVLWNLEPHCFYFEFNNQGSNYYLKILSSDNYNGPKRLEKEIFGNYEEILMPIYRELKKFGSENYEDPHWPKIESSMFDKLSVAIKQ